jgi:guanosine-3',5'-bis(diphosphate) 3'-pyrophosphohydrolase
VKGDSISYSKGFFLWFQSLLLLKNPFPNSGLLTKAFELASTHHFGQTRKGGRPYLTHPLSVARLLKKNNFSEEVVAAGLLHDVLEDTGCEVEEMERAVGAAVTALVKQVTDPDKTAPWKKRKENYLNRLKEASEDALFVSAADKIDNLQGLLEGVRGKIPDFFKSFSGGIREKIENHKNIYALLCRRIPSCELLPLYKKTLDELLEKL